jgi:hypothetical protein
MATNSNSSLPLSPGQLRRLEMLWRRWAGVLALKRDADQRLRHYYVELFSNGRAKQTKELTRADATRAIRWLNRLVRAAVRDQAAGTAGRRGFSEQRSIRPEAAAWRALWGCARALGMNRYALEFFIRNHYGRFGLAGLDDLRTMADLNRVLWGLKAMLRRRASRPAA